MVRVNASIDIATDIESVFGLVTDVARKGRLDPNSAVLGIAQVSEGPVGVDTVFHYRIVIEGKIADYRSRCVAFEDNRMIETISDSDPPFTTRVTVEPIAGGVRLTQEETFEVSQFRIRLPTAPGVFGRFLKFWFGNREEITQEPAVLREEEVRLEKKLRPKLQSWLNAIKQELEREAQQVRV